MNVFDLDGVLSRRDTMATLVVTRIRSAPWIALPVAGLFLLAAFLRPTGRGRPRCHRAIVHIALAGMSESAYLSLAESTARLLARKSDNLHPGVLAQLRHAYDDGSALVTTATERELAEAYLAQVGFPDVPVHASEIRSFDGALRFSEHNVGAAKVLRLRKEGLSRSVDALYTDSASDLPLARLSSSVVLVGPGRRTVARFRRAGLKPRVLPWASN